MKRDIDRFSIHENSLDVLRRGNVSHHSRFFISGARGEIGVRLKVAHYPFFNGIDTFN